MITSDKIYIFDIIESIERILFYLENCSLDDLEKDDMRQDAVIRRFEILGEASSKVSSNTKNRYNTIAWKEMKLTRNLLIHEYRKVKIKFLFEVYENILPLELEKLKKIDLNNI